MTIVYSVSEARRRFNELIDQVSSSGEVALIERSGKLMAAMIPIEEYEQFGVERDERFRILDRVRTKLPEIPEGEVEIDVSQAIDALRKQEP